MSVDTIARGVALRVGNIVASTGLVSGLALLFKNATRNFAAFSTGGSFGIGDFTDGQAINVHAGDDGTTTRVCTVRATTAPLFIGASDRPNGEGGGDTGRSIASFEGYRLANIEGQQELGAFRVITEGATSAQYGGALGFLTKPNGSSTFIEKLRLHADGNLHHTGPGVDACASANRTGQGASTTVFTMSGNKSVLELFTGAADANGLTMGEVIYGSNLNTAGEKRLVRMVAQTLGSTANNRGGYFQFQIKADGGALADCWTANSTSVVFSTFIQIGGASGPSMLQGAATTRNAVRTAYPSVAIGSTYQSTAGKIYLKVANAAADTDWQRVTATAAD